MDDTSQNFNQEVEDERALPDNCKDADLEKAIVESDELVIPQVGMIFDSVSEAKSFYKRYASWHGFEVITRTSKNSGNGINKYITFSCTRSGKTRSTSKNPMSQHVTNKTNCRAKINVKVLKDGRLFLSTAFLDHNHELRAPKVMPLNRKLDTWKIRSHDQGGSVELHNYAGKGRHLIFNIGEAVELLNSFFVRMKNNNPNFFYLFNWNDDFRVRSVFWADAKSRAFYDSFGDAIAFNTTYITDKYNLPLVTFVGVNHHGQSILFGCGLLFNEEKSTYSGLLRSFLACMSGISPKAIVTDEGKEIHDAVAEVFPEAKHRLCLYQILRKVPLILGLLPQYREIKKTLKNVAFESLTMDEFEESWVKFIVDYNLKGNEWLSSLYFDRKLWVPVFVKETFWAGLSTIERNEKKNAFFDGFIDSQTSLVQFLDSYDNVLKSKVEKEQHADFASCNSVIPLFTYFPIEKQFQDVYTNEMFKKVQEELRGLMYCNSMLLKTEGTLCTYQVTDHVENKDGWKENIKFDVYFDKNEKDIKCICHLFEFRGILCRHILAVLVYQGEQEVAPKYILPRWRKDIDRKHTYIKTSYDDSEKVRRYNMLCAQFQEVAELRAKSKENFEFVMKVLAKLKEKLLKGDLTSCFDELNEEERSIRENEKTDKGEKKELIEEGSCSRPMKKKKVSQTNTISIPRSEAPLNYLSPINPTLRQGHYVPVMLSGSCQIQPLAFASPPPGFQRYESNSSINSGPDSVSSNLP